MNYISGWVKHAAETLRMHCPLFSFICRIFPFFWEDGDRFRGFP